jgi:hypothetical protein
MLHPVRALVIVALLVGPASATSLTPCLDARTPGCGEPPAVETCGNCADDDADGLVDWEDADCCTSESTLALEQLTVRGERVRLSVRHTLPARADDTTVQIADDAGVRTCATLGAGSWGAVADGRTLRFAAGRARRADGFRRARLDDHTFRATVRGAQIAALGTGDVHLTLRIGSACARASTALQPRRRLLVAP